jgi:hypothetical protein
MGTVRIESVGEAQRTGSSTLRIPIVLRDETGRSLAISLTVEIDVCKTESPN